MKNRMYQTPNVDREWSASRNTHHAVAVAIHAISDSKRSPEAIWEAPTSTEFDVVANAVEDYLLHGDFDREPDGKYPWGNENIVIREE
jgi:hypothetical protein